MSDLALHKDFDPHYGDAVALSPLVRRIVCRNPSPFTSRGTSTYLVGRGDVAVIDPGPDDPAHRQALLAALDGARVAAILLTHGHHDHVGGVPAFREAVGAPVLAAVPSLVPRMLTDIAPKGPEAGRAGAAGPDRVLADGEILEGPDWRLEVVATPGHASDHVALAFADEDILFSGDHVMGWSTTVVAPPDGHMRSYLDSLRRLIDRPETRYLPGHGGPIPDGPAFARGLLAHRLARESAVLERLRDGDREIAPIVARLYRGLDDRLVRAAGLSVLAHVEHLIERGLASADGVLSLDGRYSAA